MDGYKPSFVYPFAVNGLNSVTQVIVILYGYKLSDRFKIQYTFFAGTALILSLPLLAHFLSTPTVKFYVCFVVLLLFGVVGGMV